MKTGTKNKPLAIGLNLAFFLCLLAAPLDTAKSGTVLAKESGIFFLSTCKLHVWKTELGKSKMTDVFKKTAFYAGFCNILWPGMSGFVAAAKC